MRIRDSRLIVGFLTLAFLLAPLTSAFAHCGSCGSDTKHTSHSDGKDIVDTAVAAGSFNTLVAAVQAAGLVDALKGEGPFTVFAPSDEAFAKLPAGTVESLLEPKNRDLLVSILKYHVVAGRVPAKQAITLDFASTLNGQRAPLVFENDKLRVDVATVVKADIETSNGIIHVIDSVLLPADKNLVQTAVAAGTFQTLVAAVKTAGLADVLSSGGPFTVFAPTNEAFAALPKGTVDTLLQPENRAKLVEILKYHVVEGRVYADQALAAGQAATLQQGKVRIATKNGTARINDSRILKTDIETSNGVIHVIDQVLMPADAMSSIGGFDSNLQTTLLQSNSCPNSANKKAGMQAIGPGQKCTGYVETRSAMR
jgi:transforming growth factor-beta-induced protein